MHGMCQTELNSSYLSQKTKMAATRFHVHDSRGPESSVCSNKCGMPPKKKPKQKLEGQQQLSFLFLSHHRTWKLPKMYQTQKAKIHQTKKLFNIHQMQWLAK